MYIYLNKQTNKKRRAEFRRVTILADIDEIVEQIPNTPPQNNFSQYTFITLHGILNKRAFY